MPNKTWKIKVAAQEVSVTEMVMDGHVSIFTFANGVQVTRTAGATGHFRLACGKHRKPKCEHLRIVRRLVVPPEPTADLI
jgi:hypothetical protein